MSLLLLLISCQLLAQKKSNKLQVTGKARVVVSPDVAILSISVSQIRQTMKESIDALANTTNQYSAKLKEIGFEEGEIKTTSFSVYKNQIRRGSEYIDSGYVASQQVKLEFVYTEKIIPQILDRFSESDLELNFSFRFKLSEELKQKVQKEIIADAIKDGQMKATAMADAANLTILELESITYGSWSNSSGMERVTSESRYGASAAVGGSRSFNFRPDDLVFNDTVTIYYIFK